MALHHSLALRRLTRAVLRRLFQGLVLAGTSYACPAGAHAARAARQAEEEVAYLEVLWHR